MISNVMKKDERVQEQLNDNLLHIDELEDKIKEQDEIIRSLEKKRDLAKIEM